MVNEAIQKALNVPRENSPLIVIITHICPSRPIDIDKHMRDILVPLKDLYGWIR